MSALDWFFAFCFSASIATIIVIIAGADKPDWWQP